MTPAWLRWPLAITGSQAPRALVGLAGGALAIAVACLLTLVVSAGDVVAGVIGGALVALALAGRRAPWTPRVAAMALGGTLAALTVPRELGLIDFNLTRTWTETRASADWRTNCTIVGGGGASLPTLADEWVLDLGGLTGNVGELLRARHPAPDLGSRDRVLTMRVDGDLSIPWTTCLPPIYQRARVRTTLRFTARASARWAGCSARGTLELEIDRDMIGSESCRHLRAAIADHALDRLGAQAADLID